VLYLLAEDNPAAAQVWLRVPDVSVLVLSADYNNTPQITCRPFDTGATPAVVTPRATFDPDNPPIPVAITATPEPLVPAQLLLTNEDAQLQLTEIVPELRNPVVVISEENITITGDVDIPLRLGLHLTGALNLVSVLEIVENEEGVQKLYMDVTSVTVSGRDYTGKDEETDIELAMNNWFTNLLRGREVVQFVQSENSLVIDVMQPADYPEATAEATEAIDSGPTATPTVTPTLIIRTLDAGTQTSRTPLPVRTVATSERTPLPLRTIDPNATLTPVPTGDGVGSDEPRFVSSRDATNHASVNIDGITAPYIAFTDSGMSVQGFFGNPGLPFELDGILQTANGQVQFVPQTLDVNNISVPIANFPLLTDAINGWLPIAFGDNVESFSLEDGGLLLNPTQP
jgi:hypothetical protein